MTAIEVQHQIKLQEEIYTTIRKLEKTDVYKVVNLPLPFILPLSHWPTKRLPLGYKLVPSPQILSSDHEPSKQAEYQM